MVQARKWTGMRRALPRLGILGCLGFLWVLGHLGAQEPAQTSPEVRKNSFFNQDSSREKWQMPARVMDEIGIRPGMTVADVGAEDGWFTFYLADRVGASGRVIAEDINVQALEAVRRRCAEQKVSNVSILVGEPENPKLPAGAVDLALMVNVLSALGNANAETFLGNLAKCLKPEGRLVIIDWDPVKLHQTIKREFDPEFRQTFRRLQDADFEVMKTLTSSPGRACGSASAGRKGELVINRDAQVVGLAWGRQDG
jgi:ubiquinone/menaquinone biosynthesis C-methylase UbiE